MGGAGSGAGRVAVLVLLGLAALVALASARLLLDGRGHLAEATRFQAAGEHERALVALEDAARAYLPGSPFPARALHRLSLLARAHEMRGETAQALKCWEVVRRSILASRHVTQPHADLLEAAERQLHRLSPAAADKEAARERFDRPRDPHPLLSLLLFAGLAGWLGGSVALLIPRTAGGTGRARALAWLAVLGGSALWLSMSWLAG